MEAKMNDNDLEEVKQMRCALTAIADEVQKFHNESSYPNEVMLHNEDILSTALRQCKSTLKLKHEQIRILRQHLKTACLVAKSLSTAKERETASLNKQLNIMRNDYWALMNQEKEKSKLIYTLQADNETIRDKLVYLSNFIQLGYQGLQNVQNEKFEDTSSLKQLQKIIYFCGQYYADYCNKSEKCKQLEQKNRFLNSKLRILESHLEITSNELQNLTGKRIDYLVKTPLPKSQNNKNCVYAVCSESQISSVNRTDTENKKSTHVIVNRNVTNHLSTIKKLLHDQDNLLKDLKCISKEINLDLKMEKR